MNNLSLTNHDAVASQSEEYLRMKLERVEEYSGPIASARAVFRRNHHHRSGDVWSLRVQLDAEHGLVTAACDAPDERSAIDRVQEKLEQQYRHRRRSALQSNRKRVEYSDDDV